jgi:hypothetical protein
MRPAIGLVTGLLIAAPAFGQDTDAEKLYRAMEKAVLSAKSLKVVGEANYGGEKWKLAFWTAEGKKALLEQSHSGEDLAGLPQEQGSRVWSDGKSMVRHHFPLGGLYGGTTPAGFTVSLQTLTLRLGLSGVLDEFDQKFNEPIDVSKVAVMSDFKLGKAEKIGDKQAVVVHFNLKNPARKCTLWLDAKTNLPLKYRAVLGPKAEQFFEETYTEFALDAKIDAKIFEPK